MSEGRLQKLVVLGATGTIGLNTLDVASRHPERFEIYALSAHSRIDELAALCERYRPRYAVTADALGADKLKAALSSSQVHTEILVGDEGLRAVVADPQTDQVMAGIVGAAGLMPVLEAIKTNKRVLLANKEPLVMAGAILMPALAQSDAVLVPVDSEHNAIFQCLPGGYHCGHPPEGVEELVLTASGGPFRDRELESFGLITAAQAVQHPNWSMGAKISVDSATMMNKGLEWIEAVWLFDLPYEQIKVVLHPQSIVHSMVSYADGSVLAQMGQPDMRTPIAQALAWPERIESGVERLNLEQLGQLDFRPVEAERYPCLGLARAALQQGGVAPTVLNAANEVAVAAFLAEQIAYLDIPRLIESSLDALPSSDYVNNRPDELPEVLAVDAWTRTFVNQQIGSP
ncbi:MAG: 1-deoxy-D-xylulose-5-phosphate reductoisomerase [Salinisphaeraceae bacterium]|nr:1-deoxy-D-xylulose-5-phosphate reductoisomerase [Salinisphaeraceae bacterium]